MQASTFSNLDPIESISDLIGTWSIRFSPRFMTYVPKQNIYVETKNYILKTATSTEELINVFRLRYLNFLENNEGHQDSYDMDEFDHICDHLIIKTKEDDEVVGTYRILCSLYTDKFYSQGEFDLSQFLLQEGVKLELGRACIDTDHRNGNVIDLLWRGIIKYVNLTKARYLFGCSSIKSVEPQMAYNFYKYFQENGFNDEQYNIRPIGKYKMDFSSCSEEVVVDMKKMIPSLLRSYLTAGATVQGRPALDCDFECIDFLTILNLEEMTPLFRRRYLK